MIEDPEYKIAKLGRIAGCFLFIQNACCIGQLEEDDRQ